MSLPWQKVDSSERRPNGADNRHTNMIEDAVHIHDRFQFEIKLAYNLHDHADKTTYGVETYIFFPDTLGVNRHSYTKDDFYSDIQAYVRFKTPSRRINNLVAGDPNPLDKLKRRLTEVLARADYNTRSNYEYEAKMFCNIVKSALRDHVQFVRDGKQPVDVEDLVRKYADGIDALVAEYRKLRSEANVPGAHSDIFAIYLYADEYVSLLIETYTYQLLEYLRKHRSDMFEQYKVRLLAIVNREVAYRRENGYPSIPQEHSENEMLMFRKNVLKKYMGSALFLNTRVRREGELIIQAIFALAAGLAMLFATAVAFFTQRKYGTYTFPFVIAVVIGYMFKDRMKELTRLYLGGKVKRFLYDHRMNIYSSARDRIGRLRESFDFIKERDIPGKILRMRNRDHITEIESDWMGEKTILYRKRVTIFTKKLRAIYNNRQIESINDIMRFNVTRFLGKMDDPKKPIYVADETDYHRIYGERVYHLNMITRYIMENTIHYKRFRIVLNRDGIKRIETVADDEEQIT